MSLDIPIIPNFSSELLNSLDKLVTNLDWQLDNPMGIPRPIAQTGLLEQIGGLLWEASGLTASDLKQAIAQARTAQTPVRLVITGPSYQHYPWELLYFGDEQLRFIGQHSWCTIIRRTLEGTPTPLNPWPLPARILLFIASPEDLNPERHRLDFEEEEALLFTALDRHLGQGEIVIDVAEDGTLPTLLSRLEHQSYQVVILSMHGVEAKNFHHESERGLLFEEEKTGRSQPIAGSVLAHRLDRLPPGHRPEFLVVSACRSAKAEESARSIASVIQRLHEQGIPRILGMRLSVQDNAASAFNAELFRRIVLGDSVGRALALARETVASGTWMNSGDSSGQTPPSGDSFAQWTLPVLFDNTTDGPLIETTRKVHVPKKTPPSSAVFIGENIIPVLPRGAFIGRRTQIRQYLRNFIDDTQPAFMFTGGGGVGKTTLAGHFAQRLLENDPTNRVLVFRAPFDFKIVYEILRKETFRDQNNQGTLLTQIQTELNPQARIALLLQALGSGELPYTFILDNLESLQALASLDIVPDRQDSLEFLRQVAQLPPPTRIIFTGRYPLQELKRLGVQELKVPGAPLGDVLQKMSRMAALKTLTPETKREIYRVLGGNHRAIEWLGHTVASDPSQSQPLLHSLNIIQAPPHLVKEAIPMVLDQMRENLVFGQLRQQLTAEEDRLLQAATLLRNPVTVDGFRTIALNLGPIGTQLNRLVELTLVESTLDPLTDLTFYELPPVIKGLIKETNFDPAATKTLHKNIGHYYKFQEAYVTRKLSDALEAIYHFRTAEAHELADEISNKVSGFYYQTGQYTQALTLTQDIIHRIDPPALWWAWNLYGMCQVALGNYSFAKEALDKALPLSPSEKEKGATLNNLGTIYYAEGEYATGLSYLEECLEITRAIGDKAGEGTTLNSLGGIYLAQGDYITALDHLEQSLTIRRTIGDKTGEGTTLNNLSQIYDASGDYATALHYLEECLKIQRSVVDKSGEGTTLNNISQIYHARGDYATALRYLEECLEIQRSVGDRSGEGTTLHNLGENYSARGDYPTALDYLEQSLTIRCAIGDKAGEGVTLNSLGGNYKARGDYATALHYLKKSLEIRRAIGNKAGEADTLNILGLIFQEQGDNESALRYLEQGLEICRTIGDKAGEGRTLNNLCLIYLAQDDNESALRYLEQSLAIRRTIGDKAGEGTTLNNIGVLIGKLGNHNTALRYLEQSLEIQRSIGNKAGEGTSLNSLSGTYHKLGDYPNALHYLKQSFEIQRAIGNKAGMIPTLYNLGQVAMQAKKPDKALEYWGQALKFAQEINNAQGIFHTARTLGKFLLQGAQQERGRQLLELAISVGKQAGFTGVDALENLLSNSP